MEPILRLRGLRQRLETNLQETQDIVGRETMPWLTQVLRAITVHGVARVLIAAGIALPTALLTLHPSDWTIVAALLMLSPVMVCDGARLRAYEIDKAVFGGRILSLQCSASGCKRIIRHEDTELTIGCKPEFPFVAKCEQGHLNIVQ